MDVRFGGEIVFGHEPFEVLAISLHPLRATVFVAACSAGGCELIEADCVHGDILARTPLSRRVRHLRHQVVKADEGRATDGTMLILAYEDGDVEVWDAHRQVLQDRLLPSKKDEGKAVTALSSSAVGTVAIVYYTRGGSVVERSEACTGKTLRSRVQNQGVQRTEAMFADECARFVIYVHLCRLAHVCTQLVACVQTCSMLKRPALS
jgi:hypothetical protein